jgi:hypothetical protein
VPVTPLVLDAPPADIDEPGLVQINGSAELQAIGVLGAALERVQVDPFRPEYKGMLCDARLYDCT